MFAPPPESHSQCFRFTPGITEQMFRFTLDASLPCGRRRGVAPGCTPITLKPEIRNPKPVTRHPKPSVWCRANVSAHPRNCRANGSIRPRNCRANVFFGPSPESQGKLFSSSPELHGKLLGSPPELQRKWLGPHLELHSKRFWFTP